MTIEPDILPVLEADWEPRIAGDADRKMGTGLWLAVGGATVGTWALAPLLCEAGCSSGPGWWLIKGPQAVGEGALHGEAQ